MYLLNLIKNKRIIENTKKLEVNDSFCFIEPDKFTPDEQGANSILSLALAANRKKIPFTIIDSGLSRDSIKKIKKICLEINPHKDLCVVFFTSGTTGKPKAIQWTTGQIVKLCRSHIGAFKLDISSRIASLYPPSSIGGFMRILNAASLNAKFCHIDKSHGYDGIVRQLKRKRVNFLHATPEQLFRICRELEGCKQKKLNIRVATCGSGLSPAMVRAFIRHFSGGYSYYAATEFSFFYTDIKLLESNNHQLVGGPTKGIRARIIDRRGRICASGTKGEIAVSGDLVSVSCLKNYRTGDVGYLDKENNLFVIGRIDDQLKIRGYRVNISEIESHYSKYPVLVFTNIRKGESEMKLVIIFETEEAPENVIEYVNENPPHNNYYLRPDYVFTTPHFDKLTTDKIDRKKIIEKFKRRIGDNDGVSTKKSLKGKVVFSTDLEIIYDIFSEVLQVRNIGHTNDFFKLGGDSLSAIKVISLLNKKLKTQFPPHALFKYSTIKALEKYIKTKPKIKTLPKCELSCMPSYQLSLSNIQKRLYFLYKLEPQSSFYNLFYVWELRGGLVTRFLKRACQVLVNRHESLRTNFITRDGEPARVIHPKSKINFHYRDYSNKTIHKFRHINLINKEIKKPFNLKDDQLIKFLLLKISKRRYFLAIVIHHIIVDEISVDILNKELSKIYNGFLKNERVSLPQIKQHSDFVRWENSSQNKKELKRGEKYWLNKFKGDLPSLNIPTDKPRTPLLNYNGKIEYLNIEDRIVNRLDILCKRFGVTHFVLLLGVFKVWLRNITGQNDIIVGTPLSRRYKHEFTDTVGLILNVIALRSDLSGNPKFPELLNRMSATVAEAIINSNYSLDDLVRKLRINRDLSRPPLFSAMFQVNMEPISKPALGDVDAKSYSVTDNTTEFEFKFVIQKTHLGNSRIKCEYNSNLFACDTIIIFLGLYYNLLKDIFAHPGGRIDTYSLLSKAEKDRLLKLTTSSGDKYPRTKTIKELFEINARKMPQKIAVQCGGRNLSYRDLNENANRLAYYLCEQGIVPGHYVGIMFNKSIEAVIAILAVLKVGAAYVPVNINYPKKRIKYIIRDAAIKIILTSKLIKENLGNIGALAIDAEYVLNYSRQRKTEDINSKIGPKSTACVFYTSGSTGNPKGVLQSHRGIINNIYTKIDYLNIKSNDLICQNLNYAFAASPWQIFTPLLLGLRIMMYGEDTLENPVSLLRAIKQDKITIFESTPSYFKSFVDILNEKKHRRSLSGLKSVILTGEELPVDLANRILKLCGATLYNAYGPTEYTDDALYCRVEPGKNYSSLPLGVPAYNTQVYVLDENMQLTPPTKTGEIYISGDGLASGYLNLDKETKKVFPPHPFKSGKKIYKTGDLARVGADFNLYFKGRSDRQVQIRGNRVETGEVEIQMRKIKKIKEAVVEKYQDFLIGYFTTKNSRVLKSNIINSYLKEILPSYMIPAVFIHLKQIPLNSNGKLDCTRLPMPQEADLVQKKYEAPLSQTEKTLAQIWCEILDVKKIGRNDNFFDIGGHSLKAIILIFYLNKRFNTNPPLKTIFKYPALKELSQYIDSRRKIIPMVISCASQKEYYPLSYAQKRMWVLYQLEPTSPFYNINHILEISGRLNVPVLKGSLRVIVDRHQILRTNFFEIKGRSMQFIHPKKIINLQQIDLSYIKDAKRKRLKEEQIIQKEISNPFKLETDHLIRTKLVKISQSRYALIVVMHHIISDGWSMDIFYRELCLAYNTLLKKEVPDLVKMPVQYKDFAVWEQSKQNEKQLKKQEKYWLNKLRGDLPVFNLPADRPRSPIQTYRGGVEKIIIDSKISKQVKRLAHETGTTVFSLLLTIFNVFIYRLTNKNNFIVGSLSVNRNMYDTKNIIGMFLNNIAIRTKLSDNQKFLDLLEQTSRNVIEAADNDQYPFERLIEKLHIERDMSRSPLFNVMFQYDPRPDQKYNFFGLNVWQRAAMNNTAKFDLKIRFREINNDEIILSCEYNTDLFYSKKIQSFLSAINILIRDTTANPHKKVSELKILAKEENRILLRQLNDTEQEYPKNKALHELFEEQVRKTPENIAIEHKGQKLTYFELNRKANRLARRLKHVYKIECGGVIAVAVDRNLDFALATIAIHKSGACCLYIDKAFPENRILNILKDSHAELLLVSNKKQKKHSFKAKSIIQINNPKIVKTKTTNPQNTVRPSSLAYLVYTSGSTGVPKGVMLTHRSIVNSVYHRKRILGTNKSDIFALSVLTGFVAMTFKLYTPLTSGNKLIIYPEEAVKNAPELFNKINNDKITILDVSYQNLVTYLNYIDDNKKNKLILKNLRIILPVGEKLDAKTANTFLNIYRHVSIYTTYGMTEFAGIIFTNIIRYQKNKEISKITEGIVPQNSQAYILDKNMKLLPFNIPGNVYFSGDSLSSGYLNDKKKTKEVFLPHPFIKNKIIFNTGDIGKLQSDGKLEIIGRSDNQVKIRGYRIELEEVERILCVYSGIKKCAVVIKNMQKENVLCAYYVSNKKIKPRLLSGYFKSRVPDYMIPQYFIHLEKLPLTPNGKLDRNAFPEPSENDLPKNNFESPHGPIEERLVIIWKEILHIKKISKRDNFFNLGGHSLKAIRVKFMINRQFNINFPLREIFRYPKLEELGLCIKGLIIKQRLMKKAAKILKKLK